MDFQPWCTGDKNMETPSQVLSKSVQSTQRQDRKEKKHWESDRRKLLLLDKNERQVLWRMKTLIPVLSAHLAKWLSPSLIWCSKSHDFLSLALYEKIQYLNFHISKMAKNKDWSLACWSQWSFAIDIQLRQFSSSGTVWIKNKALILWCNFFFSNLQFRKYIYQSGALTKRKRFTSN